MNVRHNVGKVEAILCPLMVGKFLHIALVIVRITLNVIVHQIPLNVLYFDVHSPL
jgi:hypothetical protein